MEEEILLNIQFNRDEVKGATENIVEARKQIDALIAVNKQLVAQGEKNSAAYVKNEQTIKALNTEVGNNSKIIQANTQANKQNADSIDALKKRNSEIIKLRDQESTATEEGRKKIAELNKEYDENSKVIAKNSTAVEKQRFNIGNYQSALDGIAPGLGGMTKGLTAATEGTDKLSAGAKRFILTGIGAIIAGVGLALGALMKYFEGSEEGQNRLNKIMAVGSAIMEQFMNVVEDLGEAIFDAINNPQEAINKFGALIKENIINRFEGLLELIPQLGKAVSLLFEGEFAKAGQVALDAVVKVGLGVEDATSKIAGLIDSTTELVNAGIENGKKLAALQAKIDLDERKLVTERARTALEVSKLRAEAIELEGDARKKVIQEAIALEEALSKKEVDLAKTRKERAALNVEANGNDKDALNELAAAQAAVIQAEAAAFDNTLRFRKELEGLNEADAKKAEDEAKKKDDDAKKAESDRLKAEEDRRKQLAEQNAHDEQVAKDAYDEALQLFTDQTQALINEKKRQLLEGKISQEEYNKEIEDLELASLETRQMIEDEFAEHSQKTEQELLDFKIRSKQQEVATTKAAEDAKIAAVQNGIGIIASAFNRQSVAYKVLASAQTLITTYQSAIAAFNSLANIPYVGTILGIAAAAAATANGLAAVARINQTPLPKMAKGGRVRGKSHAQGGEELSIGGTPVAEVESGEDIFVLKRGATDKIRALSTVNQMAGGRDFFSNRSPVRHAADGGIVARQANRALNALSSDAIAEAFQDVTIVTKITDLERVNTQRNKAVTFSELQ